MTSLFLRNSQKDHLFLEQQSAKRISKKDIYRIHAKKTLKTILDRLLHIYQKNHQGQILYPSSADTPITSQKINKKSRQHLASGQHLCLIRGNILLSDSIFDCGNIFVCLFSSLICHYHYSSFSVPPSCAQFVCSTEVWRLTPTSWIVNSPPKFSTNKLESIKVQEKPI